MKNFPTITALFIGLVAGSLAITILDLECPQPAAPKYYIQHISEKPGAHGETIFWNEPVTIP